MHLIAQTQPTTWTPAAVISVATSIAGLIVAIIAAWRGQVHAGALADQEQRISAMERKP